MLLGHDEAWREWRAAIASERMHHAWLLTGPRGLGKGTFARDAASELVAEPGVHQPQTGAHPDILTLEHLPADDDEAKKRDEGKPFKIKRNIAIDQIRRLQARLTTRPTLGERRAVIVDPADDMERSAANALLKSLEEPPRGTVFLLIAHQPARLPPTIRSRCRLLRFAPLPDGAIETLLREHAPEADGLSRAAALLAARGSPGAALSFTERGLGPVVALVARLIDVGDTDLTSRTALGEAVGARPDRERIAALFELARGALAARLGGASRERQSRIIAANAALTTLAGQAPTYNFDPALLVLEIGGLLASAADRTEAPTAV
jgi:DNA polymerase-3 subunit delta'